jgi:predicted YcjX-like family ATPase
VAQFQVEVSGVFTTMVDVEIDDALLKNDKGEHIGEEAEQELVYKEAEKILQDDIDNGDFSKIDNIDLECIDYTEIEEGM